MQPIAQSLAEMGVTAHERWGIFVSLLSDAAPTNWQPLWQIVATMVGGGIAWVIARQSLNMQKAERLAEKRQYELRHALTTMAKIGALLSHAHVYQKAINTALQGMDEGEPTTRGLWKLETLNFHFLDIHFTEEESAYLMTTKVLQVFEITERHSALLKYAIQYDSLRALVFSESVSQMRGMGEDTPTRIELKTRLGMNAIVLERLQRTIAHVVNENFEVTVNTFYRLRDYAKNRFGDEFPDFVFTQED